MKNTLTIAFREFKLFFISPAAYLVAIAVNLVLGIIFYTTIQDIATLQANYFSPYAPTVQEVIGPMLTILLFTTPAITMRSFAEEQRTGTMELLLTSPVRDIELVIGKWLGTFLFLLVLLAISFIYPIIMSFLVTPGLDWGLALTGYLGLILLCSALAAIGVAISSLFSNQIAAFFCTMGIFLLLWLIGAPAEVLGATGGDFLQQIDLRFHFYPSFFVGLIELKDIVYFIGLTIFGIFLGIQNIESRRWK